MRSGFVESGFCVATRKCYALGVDVSCFPSRGGGLFPCLLNLGANELFVDPARQRAGVGG